MKRIEISQYGAANVLEYDERPSEGKPSDGELRIDIRAVRVNPADLYLRRGGYELVATSLPFVPGLMPPGSSANLDPGVSGFHVGDRVDEVNSPCPVVQC